MAEFPTAEHSSRPTDPAGAAASGGGPRLADLSELPPTLNLTTAGRLLGIGRSTAYALVHSGQFPCPTFRVGHQHRVATAILLQLLGVSGPEAEMFAPSCSGSPCLHDSSHQL